MKIIKQELEFEECLNLNLYASFQKLLLLLSMVVLENQIKLILQKLRCPKCGRVLGGKATTKKNGNAYFYYYCNDCKIEFKEKVINDYFNQFISELVEYDSVVNQFFLPMIKQKFDEPKEQLEKEINEQKVKLERIKKAYIYGAFEVQEYKEEKKIVENAITELENKLEITNCTE